MTSPEMSSSGTGAAPPVGGPAGSRTALLRLNGELDAGSGRWLLAAVERELRAGHRRLVIDLSASTYCNVHGVRALLQAARMMNHAGGRLRVRRPNRLVRRIAEVGGWTDELGV